MVLAPDETEVQIVDGPQPTDITQGIHSWTVVPGPMTIAVQHGDTRLEAPITIPKGLGTLMLDLRFDAKGELEIGYF